MSLPCYEQYKDSGVEWIREIPEGWYVKKVKYLTENLDGKRIPLNSSERSSIQGDYPYYGANGIVDYVYDYIFDGSYVLVGEDGAPFFIFGRDVAFYVNGKFWVNNHAHILRPLKDCPAIITHLLNSVDYKNYISGSTRDKLTQDQLSSIQLLEIPLPEQTAIASFLDRKTAEIDQLIANKEKLIALYEEEKTAIINRAVTRGLDPAVKTKPSGVDWLGGIPEHWEVKRLKYVIESITGGGTPATGNPLFWNGTIPWVSPKDMKINEIFATEDYVTELAVANSSTTLVAPNTILVVVRSGILKHTFPVAINKVTVCLNQDMKAIMPANCINETFLFWKFKGLSNIVLTVCNKMGATVDSIEVPDLLSLLVTFPQKEEQTAIVAHIETECARLDTIIDKFKKQIELFKEYRTTLISEVVTGKIDVRGEVAG